MALESNQVTTESIEDWLSLAERFAQSMSSRRIPTALEEFSGCVRAASGEGGVLLSVTDLAGERHVVSAGMTDQLVRTLTAAGRILPEQLGGIDGEYAPDLVDDERVAGTFLAEAIVSAGFRGVYEVSVRSGDEAPRGLLQVLIPGEKSLRGRDLRFLRMFSERVLLAIDHLSLASSASAASERLQAVIDAAQDAIVVIDDDCMIRSVNPATGGIFGYAPREIIGRSLVLLLAANERARVKGAIGAAGAMHDVVAVGRDGRSLCLDISISSPHSDGRRTVVMRDVSARKAAEARMRDADRLAAIGTLAAGLGHDMSNMLLPLRAHLNAVEARGCGMAEESRQTHFGQIRASIAYLQHLADSLHSLALDPDGEGDGIGSTDLAAWWAQSGALLSKSLHRAARLKVEIDDAIPAVAIPPHAITRAMLNLLVNAAEAMPRDRAPEMAEVVLRIRSTVDHATVEVVDNGLGMSPTVLRRVFDMFFTTKMRGLGTGLGLPLVRRVVERAGGRVDIESRLGIGTTVRLVLPFADRADGQSMGMAVVRVDDGRVGAVLVAMLESLGFEVEHTLAPDDADLLVIDARRASLADAARWSAAHPPERLVVVGPLHRAEADALARLGVTLIPDPTDLPAIERALEATLQDRTAMQDRKEIAR